MKLGTTKFIDTLSQLQAEYFYRECQRPWEKVMCEALGICAYNCEQGSYSVCSSELYPEAWNYWYHINEQFLSTRAQEEGELADAWEEECSSWKDWIPPVHEKTDLDYEWDDGDDGGDYT